MKPGFRKDKQALLPADSLSHLNDDSNMFKKLRTLLDFIQQRHPFISRLAVAKFDNGEKILKTFAHATDGQTPLPLYQIPLSDSSSLMQIMQEREP